MAFYATIVTTLGVLALIAFVLGVGLTVGTLLPGPRERLRGMLLGQAAHPIGWAWGVSLIATLGSLYLSEVANLLPCSLCWYQRIVMYPLVLVLGVGMLRGDTGVWRYGLPLPVVGLAISIYHVTIQWMPNLDVGACSTGAPCTGSYLRVFGFVSIPTMAGGAFALIIGLMLLVRALDSASSASEADPSL